MFLSQKVSFFFFKSFFFFLFFFQIEFLVSFFSAENREIIESFDGVSLILKAMKNFPDNEELQNWAVEALVNNALSQCTYTHTILIFFSTFFSFLSLSQ